MIKINDMVQLFQLARESLRLRFLTRRDKSSDTNLLFNLFIFSFAFKLHRVERPQPPRLQLLFRFRFHSKLKLINFWCFLLCFVREMKKSRRGKFPIRFPTYHQILAIRQFFSVHFILLRSLDFLIFYHSLAEWVKSPSLAVHLNFNNFCRPALCRSLRPPRLHSSLSFAASCYAV